MNKPFDTPLPLPVQKSSKNMKDMRGDKRE